MQYCQYKSIYFVYTFLKLYICCISRICRVTLTRTCLRMCTPTCQPQYSPAVSWVTWRTELCRGTTRTLGRTSSIYVAYYCSFFFSVFPNCFYSLFSLLLLIYLSCSSSLMRFLQNVPYPNCLYFRMFLILIAVYFRMFLILIAFYFRMFLILIALFSLYVSNPFCFFFCLFFSL